MPRRNPILSGFPCPTAAKPAPSLRPSSIVSALKGASKPIFLTSRWLDNHHICPDMEAIGPAGVPKSPYFLHLASASNLPPSIRHTIISIALAHRILQSEQGFEADRAALSTRLQTHRGGAIRELAQEVKARSQTNLVTLACVLTFLFAEVRVCCADYSFPPRSYLIRTLLAPAMSLPELAPSL